MWRYPENTDGSSKSQLWVCVRNVLLFTPFLYIIGAALAWIHPHPAFVFYTFVTIYFMLPSASGLKREG